MRSRSLVALAIAIGLAAPAAAVAPAVGDVRRSESTTSAAVASAAPTFPAGVTRLSGANRYDTAVAASARYAPGVPAVFVATGTDYPDALSAAAAAAERGGPLLLTQPTLLPATVSSELKRLKPARIYLVGGTGVVNQSVATALARIAPTTRLAGPDRYTTGDAVIAAAFHSADHAIIATGRTFPDALAATGAAGSRQAPVVLVDGGRAAVTKPALDRLTALGVTSVGIVGGTAVVSAGIETQLKRAGLAVSRYGGASRYETAALLNTAYFPAGSSSTSFLATGVAFADALAAGALAGRLAAPLELSTRTCVDPSVGEQLTRLAATSTVVMGGKAVVADSAANNAHCVYPLVNGALANWAVTGWTLSTTAAAPYSDRPPVDVHSPTIKLDSSGLLIYTRLDNGQRADQPVVYAQYALSALLEYQRTGEKLWLDRAIRQAQQLVTIHTERNGAWWYPYKYPWTYYQRTVPAPWYSGMAQGEALSLFVRLADVTGDSRWDTAADHTFTSLTQPHSTTAPWASLVIDKHLYFEEFAGKQLPLLVLNGHIFATFGVYDYWRHTGNATAARYVDGAATTVLERMLPLVRFPGGVSFYCVQFDYCPVSGWQNQKYHMIHSWQLDTLARITGDTRFTTWAQQLRSDWSPAKKLSAQAPDGSVPPVAPAPQQMPPDLGDL